MGRTKQKKIVEIRNFPNVFDKTQDSIAELLKTYFNNGNAISIEVGCGEGDYTVQLAERFSNRNFVGIDIKASRIFTGAKKVLDAGMANAAFISMRVETIAEVFNDLKVDEIYIPFPDPHVRRKSAPRRLVSPEFLEKYKLILSEKGKVHFKTDNEGLFEYALDILGRTKASVYKINRNVGISNELTIAEQVTTRYERHYRNEGRIIRYICFGFER